MRRILPLLVSVNFVLSVGCGSPKPAETPSWEPSTPAVKKGGPQVWQEMGVLDVGKVDQTFASVRDSLTRCRDSGNKFVAGTIVYAMRIDHSGHVKWAYAKDSTLGDRTVEKCMLEALRKATWPVPEGGDDGLAEKPFEFPDREERPPVDWAADQVLPAIEKGKSQLEACRQGQSGPFRVTMIVNTSGKIASAGIAPPNEKGEEVVDCLVDALHKLKFPSPGSWPARVSFDMQ